MSDLRFRRFSMTDVGITNYVGSRNQSMATAPSRAPSRKAFTTLGMRSGDSFLYWVMAQYFDGLESPLGVFRLVHMRWPTKLSYFIVFPF